MPLRSRRPTQQYRGVTSICLTTSRDSTLHTSKDNSIFETFDKDFKTSTDLKECARRILRSNTLPSQPASKKKPQGDPQHGSPNCTANERVTLNQQHTGGLNCASSATTLCYTAIVTTDGAHVQRGGEKIQQQSRSALHLFGHRRSAEKQPSFKTVHFDPDLEHVRYFSNADKPLTSDTSPSFVSKNPLLDERIANQQVASSPQWEIFTTNFPDDDSTRKSMDVRVQRLYFSSRRMTLYVFIVVANTASEKSIICRFTRDYWKTVSETLAQYYRAPSSGSGQNYYKFVVSIRLFDADELNSSPLFFCVRYIVNGQEFWDDNSGVNFEVDFRRKFD
ncbi:phosphatase 1 regulatory subunit 3B [Fusarium mundagurra]|uniref:Phosphatase 1 regulatory subunit 3B n=1 Tax=Fusarium mundagurra TaxID=1567541 RepID=A0A8H5XXJ9_9HYPO|nr:phosphatase 1 regulatory subunit 3B [Fusarium mundagurra]